MDRPAPARRLTQRWDASMWSVVVAIPLAVIIALLFTARAGALTLAAYFAAAACYRGFARGTKPSAFSVRARWFDTSVLALSAIVLLILGLLAPRG